MLPSRVVPYHTLLLSKSPALTVMRYGSYIKNDEVDANGLPLLILHLDILKSKHLNYGTLIFLPHSVGPTLLSLSSVVAHNIFTET